MSGWAVVHEPDADPFRNWADRTHEFEAQADEHRKQLDDTCPDCQHTVIWVD